MLGIAMTPAELRPIIRNADIYKMSLGKSAKYQQEALTHGVLIFHSEKRLFEAVIAESEESIIAAGRKVISDRYPNAGAPETAIRVWKGSIETFNRLPKLALILHWEADQDHLHWGLTCGEPTLIRTDVGEWGQPGVLFHRALLKGWQRESLGGVPLSNIHPKARDYAINMATLNRVQSDPDYFRSLILDEDTTGWETQSSWVAKAITTGWRPKDRATILQATRSRKSNSIVRDTADYFQQEVQRMSSAAFQTAAYANGQTVMTTVKIKDNGFGTRAELEEEIHSLLFGQNYRCALTDFEFRQNPSNPHLRPSLDRKDSSQGYVPGNLQIVTRAANFFKSASDEADWALKASALEKMAIAMQRERKVRAAASITV